MSSSLHWRYFRVSQCHHDSAINGVGNCDKVHADVMCSRSRVPVTQCQGGWMYLTHVDYLTMSTLQTFVHQRARQIILCNSVVMNNNLYNVSDGQIPHGSGWRHLTAGIPAGGQGTHGEASRIFELWIERWDKLCGVKELIQANSVWDKTCSWAPYYVLLCQGSSRLHWNGRLLNRRFLCGSSSETTPI